MHRFLNSTAILLLLLSAQPVLGQPDFTGLVEASNPAVVNIETTRFGTRPDETAEEGNRMPEDMPEFFRRFFDEPFGRGGQPDRMGGGSGFIIESDGLIVTNHHVIDGADEIIVRLADRREFEAELIGSDAETDIAVLRIDAENLPTLEFGSTEDLEPGEWVIAIGSPFQFEQSVTAGIVSAKGRSQGARQQYVPFIQTDVAINRGNSGGPLISTDGEVVGINSWILSSHGGNIGLSFSIPSEVAQNSIEQLLETGSVARGFLGVQLQAVTREQADALGLERPKGALINSVEPGGPAEEAGIEVGDVILEFNGTPIDQHSELPPLVGMERPGTEAEMTIWRWGERQEIDVTLGEREGESVEQGMDGDSDAEPSNALGLIVEPLTGELRQRYGDPDGGVLIADVESDNAYRAGIRSGQLILMINNQPIEGMDDFNRIVSGVESGRNVALLVQQPNGVTAFLAYRPETGAEE
ncbi:MULTISPECIES: DegQ family serine endoprotease [unclassified Wenzhouxiangella]|uniref:DegQ family serine endoprotease n=1 Tax=unclassified Wenzhouxiangella TaxID=2613841 RepID=UPI000E32AD98|nr:MULTISPECIES: DegQ family serine endoprotease [unclassified Wenzhouxiangella]RFF26410.1 DegQ family serine endoprotease [Wenzhouxiangella sp. 15181]RFP67317.1 DegQ family serine endoprotease [Wenzhouxiangella sp. 15190]